MNWEMIFNSGKNPKWKYYIKAHARQFIPASLLRRNLDKLLSEIDSRPDAAEIYARAEYYCRITPQSVAGWENTPAVHKDIRRTTISEVKPPRQKDYYFSHPSEAKEIIENDHHYTERFKDRHREELVSLLTLNRFLSAINAL